MLESSVATWSCRMPDRGLANGNACTGKLRIKAGGQSLQARVTATVTATPPHAEPLGPTATLGTVKP